MTKPITPKELANAPSAHIPDEVIAAFNELIAETGGRVTQDAVVKRILAKMPDVPREDVFTKGWLNVDSVYRKAGWKVAFDRPGSDETYQAYWTFEARR